MPMKFKDLLLISKNIILLSKQKIGIIGHINGWAKFVRATQLCLEPVISRQELEEIQTLLVGFIHYYENSSYQLPLSFTYKEIIQETVLLVDKNAHRPRAVDFKKREFYGQVLYYFVHEFRGELSMLAFIHWIRNPEMLGNHIQFFHNFGETSVINVIAIDHCVGFLKVLANKHIIVDKEN
ncbi:hypothetical protein RhiirC2_797166 [Rhizophagus irregularis]|uniref:Uncharacterized protein n=1 Tax=Rhizophagus irregularis TaxID=588596 RepID=A0A2N1M8H5_9GLOM|nr:hypothetical protein RhiirC2_797166 [Rhizophagus irregularis]